MDRAELFALTTRVRRATRLPDVIALCDEVERLARSTTPPTVALQPAPVALHKPGCMNASAGASRRATALLGLGAIRSIFQPMGRSVGSWYRRGRGVPVGEGGASHRGAGFGVGPPTEGGLLEFHNHVFRVITHAAFVSAPVFTGRLGLNASKPHCQAALGAFRPIRQMCVCGHQRLPPIRREHYRTLSHRRLRGKPSAGDGGHIVSIMQVCLRHSTHLHIKLGHPEARRNVRLDRGNSKRS